MEDMKLCPFNSEGWCSGSACAWWDGYDCAITGISKALRQLTARR